MTFISVFHIVLSLSKQMWKQLIKKKIKEKAIKEIEVSRMNQEKGKLIETYSSFSAQEYIRYLPPDKARIFFEAKAGIFRHKM